MLFKILHGDESRISTDITPFHEGWAYVTHSGNFYVDMNVGTIEEPNYQRVKLNAKDAETISGLSLDELESLVSANADIVLAESQNYTNTAISELHIENGRGEGSIQQASDTSGEDGVFVGEDGIEYIKLSATVHPEAPHKEGDFIPFGATGHYAKSFSGKSSAQGWRSTADGTGAIASGDYAYAHGDSAVATGKCARAEGSGTYAKGYYSRATGQGTMAEGAASTAEGKNTRAGGQASHAEGVDTTAGGTNSHAEGETTKASGRTSHAEGRDTEAKGYYAHAEGRGTIARTRSQHAEGEYNIADPKWNADGRGRYIHITGNGSSTTPSNAYTLDWEGNAWFAGGIYVGGTNQDEAKDIVGAIDELGLHLTAQDAIVLSESQNYTDAAINEFNIINGSNTGSLQQVADTSGSNGVYTGDDGKEYFTMPSTAHPDAPYKEGDIIQHGAIGTYSKAFGGKSSAQGKSSATDGTATIAAGDYSHAEGNTTVASGEASHSEGISTYAKGKYSHAEGNKTSATGNATHAEGGDTVASGNYSHAEGRGTVARTRSQHVEGEYNKEDPKNKANERGKYAHITGNGKSGALSNAYTLDWSGNAWFAGNVYIGGEDQDNGAVTLQTTVDDRLETDSKNIVEAINEINKKVGTPTTSSDYSEGLDFTGKADGTCRVNKVGECVDTEIIIPSVSPSGEVVTEIGAGAFADCSDITSVMIPDSVTNIGYYAFGNCKQLNRIVLPKNLTGIDDEAFTDCYELTDVYYPGTEYDWTKISIGAHSECLESAIIHYNYINNFDSLNTRLGEASLETTDKTVVGAINEINEKVNASGGGAPSFDAEADEGKFYRIVGGQAGWFPVPNAEDNAF